MKKRVNVHLSASPASSLASTGDFAKEMYWLGSNGSEEETKTLVDAGNIISGDAGKDGRVNEGRETRMTRRRFQNGWIIKKGRNFVLRYREDVRAVDGTIKRVQRSVVLGALAGKRQAKAEAVQKLRDINSGTRRPQSAMTFADFWNSYFVSEVVGRCKISTRQMYCYLGKKHLLPYFGKRPLCDLIRGEVQDFINLKERENYSPQTVRHFRNMLSKFFGAAMSREMIATNLARNLEMPTMKKVRQSRVLTLPQISDLLKTLDQELRTIFLFGLLPGLRIGEILGLRVEDFDLEGRFFHIRRNVYRGVVQEAPKTAAGDRCLPIASALLEALQGWLAVRPWEFEWVIPNDAGKPYYDRDLLRRRLWPVCDQLGIPRFGWHSLRHTFSTSGGNSGVPLPVLQYLLGHASVETTMIYTYPLLEAERKAVEQIAALLLPSAPQRAGEEVRPKVLIQ